jgi:KaiB domain.
LVVQESGGQDQYHHLQLALFIDSSLLSSLVLKQIKHLKADLNIADDQVLIYRIETDMDKVIEYSVVACPTLVRLDLHPPRCLIGELRNRDLVLAFLNIELA